MSIIKANNDAIITRNDIIGVLFTILVKSFRNQYQILKIMADTDYQSDYQCITSQYIHVHHYKLQYCNIMYHVNKLFLTHIVDCLLEETILTNHFNFSFIYFRLQYSY